MKKILSQPSLLAISLCGAIALYGPTVFANENESDALIDFLTRFHNDPLAVMNELPPKSNETGVTLFSDEDISSGDFIAKKDSQRHSTMNGSANAMMMSAISPIRGNDNPARLVDMGDNLIKNIHEMDSQNLTSAALEDQPWSDTYWPLYKGALADRYNDPLLEDAWPKDFGERYTFATEKHLPAEYIKNGNTRFLSPAEKYDLLVGDEDFTLTEKMWQTGKSYFDRNGKVETWMGLCHGWAPAAYMLSRPSKALELATPSGEVVTFHPSDIKALGTLLWAEASPNVRFIGGRCNKKNPDTDENGRVLDPQCFDTNPGSWHQSVVNQIGVSKRSFIIDATYDYQVWNQPVLKYNYTYFNPESGETFSSAQEAAIKVAAYSRDKFSGYRDASTDSIVGVQMRLTYLVETQPSHRRYDSPRFDSKQTVTYRYDLELGADGTIIGGEWYTKAHPDFLWTPSADAKAVSYYNPSNSGTVITETAKESGTVAKDEWSHYGPYQAETGTFKATLTGNNDADLYVRKSEQPTEKLYQCRPYIGGSDEVCNLDGAGSYYVSIKGYDASSDYQLNVEYDKFGEGSGWTLDGVIPTDWQTSAKRAANYSQPLSAIVDQLFEWSSN